MEHHKNTPKEEVDTRVLFDEYRDAKDRVNAVSEMNNKITFNNQSIKDMQIKSNALQDEIKSLQEENIKHKEKIASTRTVDIESKEKACNEGDDINRRVRENKTYIDTRDKIEAVTKDANDLTKKINDIDANKIKAIKAAVFPVEGLSFSDDAVLYNGIPFNQCSSAEKLSVSVAMGMAMNPKLKILLIRDGSLLDPLSMKMIAEMAAKNNAQVWIERVGEGKECSVIIEDGLVKEDIVVNKK